MASTNSRELSVLYSWEEIENISRRDWREVPIFGLDQHIDGKIIHKFWLIYTREGILYFGKIIILPDS